MTKPSWVLSALLLVAVGGAFGYLGLWHTRRALVEDVPSPDGDYRALTFMVDDVGRTPYGNEVLIVRRGRWWERYFENSVFAGYCNRGIRAEWRANRELLIRCPLGRTATVIEETEYGIRVLLDLAGDSNQGAIE